ncbi:ribonuclease P protein subunit p40 isoform X1 [Latimeria chalumnae]|uniref:Ribonuclease P/MRP subunit p40 n=1 Tax=Latimeria chalumnae TaxID=7897 RepID=H3B4N5_LATCH|nr:PREDICTED: ribonuclease P protein subunit p40 isoform X1 [Latimeria chalumnae]|eukprot:XP_005997017.1 PREDICTED: ribonuclease P protein subunit p40 isoform X1 [Latimeria chalumnae]
MLCNLQKCPRHLLVCEKSNFKNEKSRHSTHVESHYFNYRASILLPECSTLPRELSTLVGNLRRYYLVKNVSLHELVTEEFFSAFIKKGSFYALSFNTRIDQDNTVAFLPTGKLVLSVDKDTFEELGLEGRPSQYTHKRATRYTILVDLIDSSFAPGTKKHKRLVWALTEKKPLLFDLLIAGYTAGGEEMKLSSYFYKYSCKEYHPTVSVKTLRNTECPVLYSRKLNGEPDQFCDTQEFFDWLGAVSNNVECDNTSCSFLSNYCCPQPSTVMDQACLCTVTGFILPETVHQLLEWLCHYFDDPKLSQWVTLTVHGFADSPVSWRENEHGFHKGGENLYNFVIFSNWDYWLQMAVGMNDGCPP